MAIDLREGDLQRQERLGMALRSVDPVWQDAPLGLDGRMAQLAEAVGVRMAVVSSGPAASDKRWWKG